VRGGTLVEIECAHCGNRQLMQIPGTWTPIAMGENGYLQGHAIPLVMLGCPECGYIQMFSPSRVKPVPFPEQPEGGGEAKA
jgi:hypothetical protein